MLADTLLDLDLSEQRKVKLNPPLVAQLYRASKEQPKGVRPLTLLLNFVFLEGFQNRFAERILRRCQLNANDL